MFALIFAGLFSVLCQSALCKSEPPLRAQEIDKIAPLFFEVGEEAGLNFVQKSGTLEQNTIVEVKSTGAALLDFDGDGLLDILLTAGSTIERSLAGQPGFGCRLYRNLGDFKFQDVTSTSGLENIGWACGVTAGDLNGDGWDDLIITCVGPDQVFINDEGVYRNISQRAGLNSDGWSASAALADLDGDGDLDLYITQYLEFDMNSPPLHGQGYSCLWKEHEVMCGPRGLRALSDKVYKNDGDGHFEEVSKEWGFAAVLPQYSLGVVIADLVGDQRPDIFVANDSSPNYLFENVGGQFKEVGFYAGVSVDQDGQDQAGMGIAVADVDGNGHLDLVVTNFEQERNNLYLNSGDGTFFDAASSWGIGLASQSALGWGTGLFDFNGDTRLDLFVANGHVYPQADQVLDSPGYGQLDHLFLGTESPGSGRFKENGLKLGFRLKAVSRGACFGDLDNDGDVDILVCVLNGRPLLYRNNSSKTSKYLTLQLSQPGPNSQALGARVHVKMGKLDRIFEIRRHDSFQSSSDVRLHLGLGDYSGEGSATVRWPDGATESFNLRSSEGILKILKRSSQKTTPSPPK